MQHVIMHWINSMKVEVFSIKFVHKAMTICENRAQLI